MALGTVRRELRGNVVRVGGSVVVRQVTTVAGVGRVVVVAVVALVATHRGVRSNERIAAMIVAARRPCCFVVACGAVGGEACRRVVRVGSCCVVR